MKNGVKLHDWQQSRSSSKSATTARDSTDGWVASQPCIICNKAGLKGAYGNHEDGWTCSGDCEREYNKRPKYPGHTEEDFLNRMKEM